MAKKLKEENKYQKQEYLFVTKEMVSKQSRKMLNWKGPRRDRVQGFWIKKLTSLNERTAFQLNKILNGNEQSPDWLAYGQTVLCKKDRIKCNAVDNYRPISCLPFMWKLLTGIISEHLYSFLEEEKMLPEEQKGCKEIGEELKIKYYWTKQCLETAKGEVQTLQWLG